MRFLRIWMTGYAGPARLVDALWDCPAPLYGVLGQGLRALLDALLLYLPLSLMGRQPSTPSYLTFVPTASYYRAAVVLAPAALMVQWFFLCAVVHVVLRLSGRPSDIDQIMNVTGMAALVVGAFLVGWDWGWIAVGLDNASWLGVSHLVLDIWGMVIVVLGLKRLLGVPLWLGIVLQVIWIALGLPLAVLLMRAPV